MLSEQWGPLVNPLLLTAEAALVFSTARRRNGFAGVHELWTRTRVIHRLAKSQRPSLESVRERSIVVGSSLRRIGPFDVVDTLGRTDNRHLVGRLRSALAASSVASRTAGGCVTGRAARSRSQTTGEAPLAQRPPDIDRTVGRVRSIGRPAAPLPARSPAAMAGRASVAGRSRTGDRGWTQRRLAWPPCARLCLDHSRWPRQAARLSGAWCRRRARSTRACDSAHGTDVSGRACHKRSHWIEGVVLRAAGNDCATHCRCRHRRCWMRSRAPSATGPTSCNARRPC